MLTRAAPPAGDPPVGGASSGGTADAGLAALLAAADAVAAAAPARLAMASYVDAADFAGNVEDISRTVEYLQILAAGTVDRTRNQAITVAATARTKSGRGWTTGWDNGTEPSTKPTPSGQQELQDLPGRSGLLGLLGLPDPLGLTLPAPRPR